LNSGNGHSHDVFDLAISEPAQARRVIEPNTGSAPALTSSDAGPSLIGTILGHWPTALVVGVLLSIATVAGVWYLVKPKYKVVSTLHVSPVVRAILDAQASPLKWGDYRQYVGTQALTISGPAIIDKLLARQDIRSLPSLQNHPNPAGLIAGSIDAGQIPSSELMEISMIGENPQDMVAIVNGLIETYLQNVEDKEREWHRRIVTSLKAEQGELEAKLKFKNQQLQQVAVEQGASGAQDSAMLIEKWLTEAHHLLTQANKDRALARYKLDALANEDPTESDPALFQEYLARDPEMHSLKEQYRQLKAAAAADAGLGRGPMHPDVRARPAILASTEERMRQREEELVRAFAVSQKRELESQFRNADITAKVLEDELKKLHEDRAGLAGSQFLLSDLRRERDQIEQALAQVSTKNWSVDVEQKRPSHITAHAPAQVPPRPNFDKRPKICAVAVLMSFACGVGVAFLRGWNDRRIRTPMEVSGRLGVRVLGSVEKVGNDGVASGLDPRLIEPIRGISTTLLAVSPDRKNHSRLITSPTAGSGKSSMSLNLCRSLAATGRRVLLVDADNHGQGATRRLSLGGRLGLAEYLVGIPAADLIQRISTNLDVLPCGPRTESFGDLLRSKYASERLRALFREYEEVIVDSPPLLVKSDAIALATMVDEVVLVLRAGTTTHHEARIAREYLDSVRSNVVGVILNAVDARTARYGYGYGYSYANGEAT
jgi:capsular exopolysaccharide synthesis family protein